MTALHQRYLYQGDNEIGAFDLNDKPIQLRILGVGKGAEIGSAVCLEIDSKSYMPIHDHNGNVMVLMDLEGKLVQSYGYTAFGEENLQEPPLSPWRYSSKRVDEETGLVYFGRRYYDTQLGRWITPDPKGFGDGPNLYAYVHNSPLFHFDLYGLEDYPYYDHPDYGRARYTPFLNTLFGNSLILLGRHLMVGGLREPTVEGAGHFIKEGSYHVNPEYYESNPGVVKAWIKRNTLWRRNFVSLWNKYDLLYRKKKYRSI